MNSLILVIVAFLLGMWLPSKLKNIELSDENKVNLIVSSALVGLAIIIYGLFSFSGAYDDAKAVAYNEYSSNKGCTTLTRLNYVDPFHRLGCYMGQRVEEENKE